MPEIVQGSTEQLSGLNNTANWKNPGNWHWIDKNCFSWANEYLKGVLEGLEHTDDVSKIVTRINKVEVEGDVNLNQRKGKLITIYDLVITMNWSGDHPSSDVSTEGKLKIPEFDHDMTSDEIPLECSCDQDAGDKHAIKEVARKQLSQKVRDSLKNFRDELIKAQSGDVYISGEQKDQNATNLPKTSYKPKPPFEAISSTSS